MNQNKRIMLPLIITFDVTRYMKLTSLLCVYIYCIYLCTYLLSVSPQTVQLLHILADSVGAS